MLALATAPKMELVSQPSYMPELKNASFWDIQVWTKAAAYIQINLNKFAHDKQCSNSLRVIQSGNRFEIHSSITIMPGMGVNDILYCQDNKESPYYRLNCTLNEMIGLVKFAGFKIVHRHDLHKDYIKAFLDNLNDDINHPVTMEVLPLAFELGESGRAFFRKQTSTNPIGFISEAYFELHNSQNHYKFRFNYYSEKDEVLKMLVKSGYAESFEFQDKYPAVFAELKAAAAMGLTGRISEIAEKAGYKLLNSPRYQETDQNLKFYSTQFLSYSVDIMENGKPHKLSTKNGCISVDMLTSLKADYVSLQARAEQCSKRMMDRLVKASLKEGCTYIKSEQKLRKKVVSTAFDSEFTEISFSIENCRRFYPGDAGIQIGDDDSRMLNITVKIRDGGSLNISVKNENGTHAESPQVDLLKRALKTRSVLLKSLNREEAVYLITKQLNGQYGLGWIFVN